MTAVVVPSEAIWMFSGKEGPAMQETLNKQCFIANKLNKDVNKVTITNYD